MDAGRKTRRKQLQLLQNYFGCVLTGARLWQELTWGPHGLLTRKHISSKYLSPKSGYIQTCLTARGWTRSAVNSVFLMFGARFIVKGPVTQRPWCQPRSMSVQHLVPVPKFCHHRTKQSLSVSLTYVVRVAMKPLPMEAIFPLAPWTSALFLTTRNVKTLLFLLL